MAPFRDASPLRIDHLVGSSLFCKKLLLYALGRSLPLLFHTVERALGCLGAIPLREISAILSGLLVKDPQSLLLVHLVVIGSLCED